MEERKKPKVSVCVVTYNQEKYIKNCLMSALAQRHDTDIEILVGDDASTDKTGEIVQRMADTYPDTIQYFRHEINLGGCRNYQFLIERASGDFIAHLDGDDFWLPGKLEAQLRFMKNSPECPAVFTNAAVFNKSNYLVGIYNNRQPELQDINYLVRRGSYLVHSSVLYPFRFKDKILSFTGSWVDYNAFCRLAESGVLGYLNNTFVVYRTGIEGSMNALVWDSTEVNIWEALREASCGSASAQALLEGYSYFWGRTLYLSLRHGRPSYALSWARRIRREIGVSAMYVFVMGKFHFFGIIFRAFFDRFLSKLTGNPLWVRVRR